MKAIKRWAAKTARIVRKVLEPRQSVYSARILEPRAWIDVQVQEALLLKCVDIDDGFVVDRRQLVPRVSVSPSFERR